MDRNGRPRWPGIRIQTHYSRQPKLVRSLVFSLFALLLVNAFYRIIGGEFTVRGRIFYETKESLPGQVERTVLVSAKEYDVMFGSNAYGPNHRGEFNVILSSLGYSTLLVTGRLDLDLSIRHGTLPRQTVAFHRLSQVLEDIKVPQPAQAGQIGGGRATTLALPSFAAPLAWAGPARGGNRLFVHALRMRAGNTSTKEASLELHDAKNVLKLLSLRLGGAQSDSIPVVSGDTVLFGAEYYFEIPQGRPSSLPVQIKLLASRWPFSPYSETFEVSLDQPPGQAFMVAGNNQSAIYLVLLSPYNVVIFEKQDLAAIKDDLTGDFIRGGFLVDLSRSPLGDTGQTNALFSGGLVPFTILQKVLRILEARQIKIKTVQHQLDLKSGKPYEIQLGGSLVFNDYEPIPRERIGRLLQARDEAEFKNLLNR